MDVLAFQEARNVYDVAAVGIGLVGYLAPFCMIVLVAAKRRVWRQGLSTVRWRLWSAGFWLTAAASLMGPLLLLGVQYLSDDAKRNWFIRTSNYGMLAGLAGPVIAIVPLSFGKGRLRWIMLVASIWIAAILYVSLVATSY